MSGGTDVFSHNAKKGESGEKLKKMSREINKEILFAAKGLPNALAMTATVAQGVNLMLFDGITEEQIRETAIQSALENIQNDPDYDRIAAKLFLGKIYREILGGPAEGADAAEFFAKKYTADFPKFIRENVKNDILDPRMSEIFDLKKLAKNLVPARDELSKYLGVMTNLSRYALRNGVIPVELPQWTHMRIAMGLSLNEKDPTSAALDFYDHMSKLEYVPGGSTRINAGTNFPQLSNCFVINVDDDMEAIAKTVENTMFIAKGTGGIGIGFTKLRAAGSPVKTTNTESTGPIPFMKMVDTALFAVSRKGKKAGAAALYLENWHLNFPQFLDLRQNSGDPYLRTRFANTAVFISDEFMKRVQKNEDWYLFDPAETEELTELYGEDFSLAYEKFAKKAENGELRAFEKVSAREQYRQILMSLQATSHPWLTWKDAINVRALNNNTGTIHLSNLCTEITLPQDREHIATCNLASINLAAFLDEDQKTWDFAKLESATRAAIRQLDNLVDITKTPVEEAMRSDHDARALGLGMMGFADVLEKLGLSYGDEAAADLMDMLAEKISYFAIDESANLATERGIYPDFANSGWSKGLVPIDTLKNLDSSRKTETKVSRKSEMDWDVLRAKVKKGMRNATLMAIAPTANIAHIAGTTPGIDPEFSQIFSRNTLNGKFLEVNKNLVREMKLLGKWDDLHDELLINQGDIQGMDLPDELKKVYLTSFQLPPDAFINVAARAQKWVDQAISRNMYLSSRDIDEYEKIYMKAWETGLKTTYYLHVQPRHQSEQITEKPDATKVRVANRRGFGFAKI